MEKLGKLIGNSSAMQRVYQQINEAARSDIPVLLLGETGTGKDLVGRTIHQFSTRHNNPFIEVNLGAFPVDMATSELFGHEKGAYTGAETHHKGIFEQAHTGTILLNEIDTVPEKLQVSLLRILEEKQFRRIGGGDIIKSDVRVLAASNANLEDLVHNGLFRSDLFYRLDIFRVTMPPLRCRQGDIELLAETFLKRFNQEFGKKVTRISTQSMAKLKYYSWPGNIRELENVIKKAIITCMGHVILPEHLPYKIQEVVPSANSVSFRLGKPLDKIKAEMITASLSAVGNNRQKAASLLGISRRALYNKMNKYHINH